MGIPAAWSVVQSWISGLCSSLMPTANANVFSRKFVNIPVLPSYRDKAPASFWESYPYNPMPIWITSKASHAVLDTMLRSVGSLLTTHQVKRGYKVCNDLQFGASAFQKCPLPPITVPNASNAFENGVMLTEKIASWVSSGIVSGPFDFPPMTGFRINPLMAIVRNNSIRPVINMSAPKGKSFNDNIVVEKLEKIYMSTAKTFSYSVKEAGKGAIMSKFDLQNAYKIIPARQEDY